MTDLKAELKEKGEITSCIKGALTDDFRKLIISAPFYKSNVEFKITSVPKKINGKVKYQTSVYFDTRVRHINSETAEEFLNEIIKLLEKGYRNCQIINANQTIHILMNKKGYRISTSNISSNLAVEMGHNREKKYILKEGNPIDFMVNLGIMTIDGTIKKDMRKKYVQINKFLEIIQTVESHIPKGGHIIDIGCGKAYLTFALYYYLNIVSDRDVSIMGIDLKQEVISYCQDLANQLNYNMGFECADVKDYSFPDTDMVVSLHACDTATDYALYGGIASNAKIILSAPCCQHELFGQVRNSLFEPVLKHGILKERFAALLTDGLRASILEVSGYKCDCIEFVDTEHTPKNILIRAVKRNSGVNYSDEIENNFEAYNKYRELTETFEVKPTLEVLLGINKGACFRS